MYMDEAIWMYHDVPEAMDITRRVITGWKYPTLDSLDNEWSTNRFSLINVEVLLLTAYKNTHAI